MRYFASAQPLIALAKYLEYLPESDEACRCAMCWRLKMRYIDGVATNPFRFMPFDYGEKLTPDDNYRL